MAGITIGVVNSKGRHVDGSPIDCGFRHQELLFDILASEEDCVLLQPDSFDDDNYFRPNTFENIRAKVLTSFSDEEDSELPGNKEVFLKFIDFMEADSDRYIQPCY